MESFYSKQDITIFHGDCREVLAKNWMSELSESNLVDAVVTDPPYGLSFMGQGWDKDVPGVDFWERILAAMKPGALMLTFLGTRTYHRMVCAIENAGFEIRDCVMYVFGTGFPKSTNIAKAIEKTGDTEEAKKWEGFGSILKPAYEPIVLARKPFEGSLFRNVMKHGTGAMNIDGCRIPTSDEDAKAMDRCNTPNAGVWKKHSPFKSGMQFIDKDKAKPLDTTKGRWPANLMHDGSDEVVNLFSETGKSLGGGGKKSFCWAKSIVKKEYPCKIGFGDSGSAARFFYCSKGSKAERGEGNSHTTVKPLALMKHLCRLITPSRWDDSRSFHGFRHHIACGTGRRIQGNRRRA